MNFLLVSLYFTHFCSLSQNKPGQQDVPFVVLGQICPGRIDTSFSTLIYSPLIGQGDVTLGSQTVDGVVSTTTTGVNSVNTAPLAGVVLDRAVTFSCLVDNARLGANVTWVFNGVSYPASSGGMLTCCCCFIFIPSVPQKGVLKHTGFHSKTV